MYQDNRQKRALSHAYSQWNGYAFMQPTGVSTQEIETYFKTNQILHVDNEIVVTDVGYVTMAVHTDRAVRLDNAIAVPGIDSEGLRGYLVLCKNCLPYHSFAANPESAHEEARRSQKSANALLSNFGSKNGLRTAVSNTPWYSLVTEQDFESSGLCRWGANAFLQRFRLSSIAWRYGLPKILVQLAGVYGERAIAASILRGRLSLRKFGRMY